MQILHVVGARPNFMKAAPVMDALRRHPQFEQKLVHTGQHYDANMSEIFFHQLGLPEPDVNLEVGSASHTVQTAQIMVRFEEFVQNQRPHLVLVYGDVNSTVAASLVCAKLLIPVGHVEAGLRSFDRTMPEEINRLLTDQISDLLFTPSEDGDENLLREGISPQKVHRVGNVMIDTLVRLLDKTAENEAPARLGLESGGYALVTLHRPSNVDEPETLFRIFRALEEIAHRLPVVFPVHPRTRQRLKLLESGNDSSIKLIDPVGYLDFLTLQRAARVVITDSGGIQEETTYLGVPCLTVRENTERPITVTQGTNLLVGTDMKLLKAEVEKVLNGGAKTGKIPPLWDGKAGQRIAEVLCGLAP